MLITKKSILSGRVRTKDLDITDQQFMAWQEGVLIQQAFPNLTADEREFLMTGITPEEWDKLLPAEDDE